MPSGPRKHYKGLRRASPILASARRGRFDPGQPIAKIDTRPLVFVAMILAVMALLWANQTRNHALLIDLPNGDITPPVDARLFEFTLIEVSVDGQIGVDGEQVQLERLEEVIRNKQESVTTVVFSPAADLDYGTAALVLNTISAAGVHPNEICFDRLERYRHFSKIRFDTAHTVIAQALDESSVSFIYTPPSGCEILFGFANSV